jgi:hypothetical protein
VIYRLRLIRPGLSYPTLTAKTLPDAVRSAEGVLSGGGGLVPLEVLIDRGTREAGWSRVGRVTPDGVRLADGEKVQESESY